MSADSIFNPLESNPGWDLIRALSSYYGLKDYLSIQYFNKIHPEKVRRILAYQRDFRVSGEETFWKEISTGSILEGQIIELRNFQISPWFPRKPGLYWTYSAALARREAYHNHIAFRDKGVVVFDVWGKTLMTELGGVGCVNFRKDREQVFVTATASGYTERGIPLICQRQVWQKIEAELQKHQMIEVDLVGRVDPIPLAYDAFAFRSPNIPKIAISINSILNIKFRMSDLSMIVTPWTIFESPHRNQPFGFTYVTHDLYKDDITKSVDWIHNYIDDHGGGTIITDFDETLHQLNAQFPLSSCLNGDISSQQVLKYCQRIKRKFDRYHYR